MEGHNGWSFGKNHIIYDLEKLLCAFEKISDEIDSSIIENLKIDVLSTSAIDQITRAL